MEERTLFSIALVCLLFSLPALWIFSVTLPLEEQDVLFLENEEATRITGTVIAVTQKEDFTLATIERTTTIPILIFDDLTLTEGMIIEATGNVETYKGKKELLVDTLHLV